MCGLTFWFRAVIVLWFNFFDLLHLSFILKSMSAIQNAYNFNQLTIKTNNTSKVSREIWRETHCHNLHSWTFFKSYWLCVYDWPDIVWRSLVQLWPFRNKIIFRQFWKYISISIVTLEEWWIDLPDRVFGRIIF